MSAEKISIFSVFAYPVSEIFNHITSHICKENTQNRIKFSMQRQSVALQFLAALQTVRSIVLQTEISISLSTQT